MPRRKQQAPKRAAGYAQEEQLKEEEEIKEEEEEEEDSGSVAQRQGSNDPGTDEELETVETGPEQKGCFSYQNSPGSHLSNQDAENESLLSDASDQVSDVKSVCSRDAPDKKASLHPKPPNEAHSCMDKMTAVYANILSDSYWSGLGLGFKLSNSERRNCDTRNGSKTDFDWHQDALSKSLQQNLPSRPMSKPSLFSSVQLYRQNSKMCGAVFTGASRFRCRQCSAAYDTLVELTVHMNETGHYQDDNRKKDKLRPTSYSKPRKRAFQDMDKEDAQKVLKCMFCGDSFDSLQDLSVHMIKTKHYQKVPLKEPVPTISSKMVTPAKKRIFDVNRPCSPDSTTGSFADSFPSQKSANLQLSANNRYGYQNGASYTWQFEACKSQILKCMECGSSHDTLQQLTTHMMVTGHFLKVTSSASKKGKQLVLDPLAVEKMQSLSDAPSSDSLAPKPSSNSASDRTASTTELKKEGKKEKPEEIIKDEKVMKSEDYEDPLQKPLDPTIKYQYLREEDLEDGSKGGGDILKSLENTVTTAINKAQNGAPSWSAYPSIHAAYQLSEGTKPSLPLGSQVLQIRPNLANKLRPIAPKWKVMPLVSVPTNLAPYTQVKKEPEDKDDVEKECRRESAQEEASSFSHGEGHSFSKSELPSESKKAEPCPPEEENKLTKEGGEREKPQALEPASSLSNGCALTNHAPALPCINPLSALQSVLNNHLGKATEPLRSAACSSPSSSTMSMFHKSSLNAVDKPVLSPAPTRPASVSRRYLFESNDQPIDLTKSKGKKAESPQAQSCTSPPQKHALSDIADMVKVLPKATTPKPAASSRVPPVKLEMDVRRFEDVSSEVSTLHKRKGRQSNWNPQHLLILQAQFASSLFQTSEGKYLLSDLGPQERMQISKFTGLSMTTISHWLANVKYQLRKTGGTKFLKNMDKGHPIFYCSDCASQFRTPSTYISHLESHLGFQMKDMTRMAVEQQSKAEQELSRVSSAQRSPETIAGEEDTDSKFKCKLCCRTFVSKHAVKLHLSKTHSKSPEHHSQFVTDVDEE
ncbi:teashirt homolog 2 isoform X1 [Camelus ferus]|uniref:Teashirt homolog 2 isoform X1 n=6 Tax=Camelus TaxID=9836 RepID=A0A8B8RJ22_CAMFR|nr:teashirt homolog 2 isoform X1 [Camelus ferus]XP_032317282.1 teashirt homolog 2 isoform X1 [Camelus ferus]XP_032317283.1 teashirt homolog 2 isoform X1 [Camelus ferus]XP_032317284.1 teashirt homolog 2 isoform X1 [Camelus ferus]XP_032317285.1 teashirt homolog 2 isoform X1 [Camelus ferus]XP_032317286.1 teashirt homolog 2 isoform X1 [Camelus ferus]XP_032317287.1 teashirt homolog 2 isoform X1 [Camelus ferus]XP_032317288.1 teashirt homolog 2 isoform X1 [Camelus ferus]